MTCPYTHGVVTDNTSGEIVENNPEKNDNVYEVGEDVSYHIEYRNAAKHEQKPLKGIAVTIYDPFKRAMVQVTDENGNIKLDFYMPGKWFISYYDQWQKRAIIVSFDVKDVPKPPKPPEPVPKPPEPVPEPKPPVQPVPDPVPVPVKKGWISILIEVIKSLFKKK